MDHPRLYLVIAQLVGAMEHRVLQSRVDENERKSVVGTIIQICFIGQGKPLSPIAEELTRLRLIGLVEQAEDYRSALETWSRWPRRV